MRDFCGEIIMPLIEWNDVFTVNIAQMDEEHKKFIELINEFHKALSESKIQEKLTGLLDGLVNYAETHFASEERLLEKYNCAELEKQRQEHAVFMATMIELRKKYSMGHMVSAIDIMNFLKSWLIDHIMYEDKKYSDYIKQTANQEEK